MDVFSKAIVSILCHPDRNNTLLTKIQKTSYRIIFIIIMSRYWQPFNLLHKTCLSYRELYNSGPGNIIVWLKFLISINIEVYRSKIFMNLYSLHKLCSWPYLHFQVMYLTLPVFSNYIPDLTFASYLTSVLKLYFNDLNNFLKLTCSWPNINLFSNYVSISSLKQYSWHYKFS
jgi:hypothetical protein